MGKYDPLGVFLRRQKRPTVELSFRDIESLVGGILPKAALASSWWHVDGQGPQTRAWRETGYQPIVDLKGEQVRFVSARVSASDQT